MDSAAFFAAYSDDARAAARACGLRVSVVLAQWANETAYGNSQAFRYGHNFAGVSPGGQVASYPTEHDGLAAYIETMGLDYYDGVRAAGPAGALSQAKALGESPWAASRYDAGNGPGSALVGIIDTFELTKYDQEVGTMDMAGWVTLVSILLTGNDASAAELAGFGADLSSPWRSVVLHYADSADGTAMKESARMRAGLH